MTVRLKDGNHRERTPTIGCFAETSERTMAKNVSKPSHIVPSYLISRFLERSDFDAPDRPSAPPGPPSANCAFYTTIRWNGKTDLSAVLSVEEYNAELKEGGKNQLHYIAYRTPIGGMHVVLIYACCCQQRITTFRLISSNPHQRHAQSDR